MNNESKCCEKCREVLGEGHPGEVFLACKNPSCKCHAPANYNRVSHSHCWNQKQPPACGIPLEKHTQCCLCDTPAPEDWVEEVASIATKAWSLHKNGFSTFADFICKAVCTLLVSEKAAVREKARDETLMDIAHAFGEYWPVAGHDLESYETLQNIAKEITEGFKEIGRREGAESERKAVIEELLKIESEKWEDAEHCSCLGYAIIQIAGGEDTPRGKEVEKRMQDAARSEGVNG